MIKRLSLGKEKVRRVTVLWSGIFLVVFSSIVMMGWFYQNELLIRIRPNYPAMVFNTALSFFAMGFGFIFLPTKWRWIVMTLAIFVFALNFLILMQHLFKTDLYVDNLFFQYDLSTPMIFPGRTSLNTALTFVGTSFGLFLLSFRKHPIISFIVTVIGAVALTIPFINLVGYITGLEAAIPSTSFAKMALHTSFCCIIMSFSLAVWAIVETIGTPVITYSTAVAAAISTIIITAGFWRLIDTKELLSARLQGQFLAKEMRVLINKALVEDIGSLDRFAKRWEALGGYTDNLWEVDSKNYVGTLPGVKGISIVGEDLTVIKKTEILEHHALKNSETLQKALEVMKKADHYYHFIPRTKIIQVFIPIKVNSEKIQFLYATISMAQIVQGIFKFINDKTYKILVLKDYQVVFAWDAKGSPTIGPPIKVEIGKELIPMEMEISMTKSSRKTTNVGSEILILLAGVFAALFSWALIFFFFKSREREKMFEILNKNLELAKQKAKLASQAKGVFLANMSHEIRTPLNAVIGTIQLLKESELNDIQKKYLHRIDFSGRILLSLVNDILDYSKIEAGNITIEKNPVDMIDVVQKIGESFMEKSASKKVPLYLDLPDQPIPQVLGDSHRMEQVIINLLTNAFKFTEKGEVRLKIENHSKDPSSTVLRFEIIDSGIGISKENQLKLFQRFSQTETSHARKFGGVGLGLSICKGLVEKMEGQIGVNSEEGKGATFWVEIPFTYHKPEETPPPYSLENMQILILDTNQSQRDILLRHLNAWKAQVKTEYTEDLSQIQLIIISVDQGELAQKIKDKNIPVLYIDNNNPVEVKESFLMMPIAPKSLWASIQSKRGK